VIFSIPALFPLIDMKGRTEFRYSCESLKPLVFGFARLRWIVWADFEDMKAVLTMFRLETRVLTRVLSWCDKSPGGNLCLPRFLAQNMTRAVLPIPYIRLSSFTKLIMTLQVHFHPVDTNLFVKNTFLFPAITIYMFRHSNKAIRLNHYTNTTVSL